MLLFVFLIQSGKLLTQELALSPRIANYAMDVELDVENKKLIGSTTLQWKNISEEPVQKLYFHMYYNAFKNSKSTFFMERGVPEFLTTDIDEVCGWGWTHINQFTDSNGHSLTDSMKYVQTDDDNSHDQTVLLVSLNEAVLPGEYATFKYEWEAKIPKTMPRTGYNKEFYFMAQWFPKIGVLEPQGMRFAKETKWNCHQYHSNGEYYSDFGNYEVNISVPPNYIVAASGELTDKSEDGKKQIWKFKANDVIDFTWSASPHFILNETRYNNTTIRYYCYDYKEHLKDRYFNTIKFALAFLEEKIGTYPYSSLSIIDPPVHGMFTGGMEYPTLITTLSFCFFPKGIRTPETLVVHEFIHQYFMQMVATHEVEEPWMDEGITSYYESRILDSYLGENESTIDFLGFKAGNKKFNRVEYNGMKHPSIASNAIKSWEYKNGGYGEIAYNKAALWLQTLEGLIGTDYMDEMMRTYFDAWKFDHPCRHDFIAIADSFVRVRLPERFPEGLDWFFDQVLYGTGLCDYSIASITNNELKPERGFFKDRDDCVSEEKAPAQYKSRVLIHRLEELYFPIELLIRFEDGTEELIEWDGRDRAYAYEVETDQKIIYAELDPQKKIYIDQNFNNNVMQLAPQNKALDKISAQLFVRLQSLLEFISFAI